MKMVAVCKLRVAQENLDAARQFSSSMAAVDFVPKDAKTAPKTRLWLGISSDRGLCGAINSSITRGIRDSIYAQQEADASVDTKIMLIGEKCKQGLERLFKTEFTVLPPSYSFSLTQ